MIIRYQVLLCTKKLRPGTVSAGSVALYASRPFWPGLAVQLCEHPQQKGVI
jgi:hypothetical protein